MSRRTQMARVLRMLQEQSEVCGPVFVAAYMPRFGAVICRLRKRGYVIETRVCRNPAHRHRNTQYVYVLISVVPEQLTIEPGERWL